MLKTKAIIFDFDGVLAESVDIKTSAFRELFNEYPEKLEEIKALHLAHGGLSRFVKFEMIYRDILNLPLTVERKKMLGDEFSKHVFDAVISCPLVKGALSFLEKYYEKMPLFIVSGTPEEEIKEIIKKRGLDKYFKEVYGAPRKKAVLINKILGDHRLSAGDVVFIGDSQDDYNGAREAGVKFIARITPNEHFMGCAIDAKISDLIDLEKVIQ